jgi:hypothetical protein
VGLISKGFEMDTQDWVNIVLGIVSFIATLGVAKLNGIQTSLADSEKEVNALKLLIANDYVKRSDMQLQLAEISKKLDKLEDLELQMADHYAKKQDLKDLGESLGRKLDQVLSKLDNKADRSELRNGKI